MNFGTGIIIFFKRNSEILFSLHLYWLHEARVCLWCEGDQVPHSELHAHWWPNWLFKHPHNLLVHSTQVKYSCLSGILIWRTWAMKRTTKLKSRPVLSWFEPFTSRKHQGTQGQTFQIEVLSQRHTQQVIFLPHVVHCAVFNWTVKNINIIINLTISIFPDNRHNIGRNSGQAVRQRTIEPLLGGSLSTLVYVGLINKDDQ